MENALPWNKKPVKDARDTQIKQLEHEILRKDKALAELSALLLLKKKANFLWEEKGRGANTELRDRTAILDLMKECWKMGPVRARPVAS